MSILVFVIWKKLGEYPSVSKPFKPGVANKEIAQGHKKATKTVEPDNLIKSEKAVNRQLQVKIKQKFFRNRSVHRHEEPSL